MSEKRRSNFKTNRSKERKLVVTQEARTQKMESRSKRRGVVLLSLALGALLATSVAMTGTAPEARAAVTEKVVFTSNRTTGPGVNNPTGDFELFKMNPDGTGVRQLTTNRVQDLAPVLSRDKTKVAYVSYGKQTSNPQGDYEIYVMNASDGSGNKNLTANDENVYDSYPVFSQDGKKIAYTSGGMQDSNPFGYDEVYVMNTLDGSGKKNLSDNSDGDNSPDWGVQST
jgi:hypothetical protein